MRWRLEKMSEEEMNKHLNEFDFEEKEAFFRWVKPRDRTSYLICGMTKDAYELMFINREIESLVWMRDFIESGEKCKAETEEEKDKRLAIVVQLVRTDREKGLKRTEKTK